MEFTTELRTPGDPAFTSLVVAFVADAAKRSSLDAARVQDAAQAAGAGFEAIVARARLRSGDSVHVRAGATTGCLHISLLERGLPMDETVADLDATWQSAAALADRVRWISHGVHGSELRLEFSLPHHPGQAIEDPAPASATPDRVHDYTIRRFAPGDALGVARCFFLTYGYHYEVTGVYVPERLRAMNANGSFISFVAVTETGEVAAHYALRREGNAPIAEGCAAVVAPQHRRHDLLTLLRTLAEAEALALGLSAYYTEPVTMHGVTQHASIEFGAKLCGLTLGVFAKSGLPTAMDMTATAQRQSLTVYVKTLSAPTPRRIFAPPRHAAMIERMYASLAVPLAPSDAVPQTAGRGKMHAEIYRPDATGTLTIEEAGTETSALARQALDDLRTLRHLGAIYALLPLEDPGTPALCTALEDIGMFFSGIGPWMLDGRDFLRMQMPLTPIDFGAITIVGDFGAELRDYIAAESARVTV